MGAGCPLMVSVQGRLMSSMGEAERSRLRNEALGFVYQFHHLLMEFTAEENVTNITCTSLPSSPIIAGPAPPL